MPFNSSGAGGAQILEKKRVLPFSYFTCFGADADTMAPSSADGAVLSAATKCGARIPSLHHCLYALTVPAVHENHHT